MSWIETWNLAADSWRDWVVSASLASAILLVLVALSWWGLRRSTSAHVGHLLFLVPLVPLVLPRTGWIEVPLPEAAPVAAWFAAEPRGDDFARDPNASEPTRPGPAEQGASGIGIVAAIARPTASTDVARSLRAEARPTMAAWWMLGWVLVASALLVRLVAVQLATRRLLRRAHPIRGEEAHRLRAALKRLQPRSGWPHPLRVVVSDAVDSPAVWGLRRPTLVLPPGLSARLDEAQLDWILLHELAHLARRDLAVATATRVVQILWFFHPGVWLVRRASDALRECACDEAALARSPNAPRRCYAEALLEIVALGATRPRAHFALQTLNNETSLMKNRILRLLDSRRTARRGLSWSALSILAPATLAGVSLAGLQVTRDDPPIRVEEIEEVQGDTTIEIIEEVVDEQAEVRAATDRALAWLLTLQQEDGHWPTGPETEADTGEFNSIGVTGLTVLALLEQGQQEAGPAHTAAIERALAFLERVQDPETNLFGPVHGHRLMGGHAAATRAWLRGRAVRRNDDWQERSERAVAAILRARNPYGGWRFTHVPDGDADSFMTSLMLMTLAEARDAGIEVPEQDVASAFSYLDELHEPSSGRTGYNQRGSLVSRLAIVGDRFPREYSEMCTSMTIVARMAWGQDPLDSEGIRDGAHLITKAPPLWSVEKGSIDSYHWWFGTEALQPLGGYAYDYWRGALLEALLPNQSADGSWPAIDAWSVEGTSVHSTVVNLLSLQAVLRPPGIKKRTR